MRVCRFRHNRRCLSTTRALYNSFSRLSTANFHHLTILPLMHNTGETVNKAKQRLLQYNESAATDRPTTKRTLRVQQITQETRRQQLMSKYTQAYSVMASQNRYRLDRKMVCKRIIQNDEPAGGLKDRPQTRVILPDRKRRINPILTTPPMIDR